MNNQSISIVIKKLPQSSELKRSNITDTGYDIVAIDDGTVDSEGYIQYRTGLYIQLENGFHTEIWPRSSISKYDLILANSIGLVDNGYRGELLVRFKPCLKFAYNDNGEIYIKNPTTIKKYKAGDKIAQLVISKTFDANFIYQDSLNESERGVGGFGSSGT